MPGGPVCGPWSPTGVTRPRAQPALAARDRGLYQDVEVALPRTVVGQADPDHVVAAEAGGRRRGDTGLLQVADDVHVQPVELRRREAGSAEPETDDVEGDRRHQLEAVSLGDLRGQVAGLVAVALDRRPQPPRAVLFEREPHLERAEAARQLRPIVAEPGIAAGEAARVSA